MSPDIYICEVCWRDTISKSRVCARCRMQGGAGLWDGDAEDEEQAPGDCDVPRSDSQYHGENYG